MEEEILYTRQGIRNDAGKAFHFVSLIFLLVLFFFLIFLLAYFPIAYSDMHPEKIRVHYPVRSYNQLHFGIIIIVCLAVYIGWLLSKKIRNYNKRTLKTEFIVTNLIASGQAPRTSFFCTYTKNTKIKKIQLTEEIFKKLNEGDCLEITSSPYGKTVLIKRKRIKS